MNLLANFSLGNSKNLVKSADDQYTTSMKMWEEVEIAADNVDNTVDDITSMSDDLLEQFCKFTHFAQNYTNIDD